MSEELPDIHWRQTLVRGGGWQFRLTDLLIWTAFLGAVFAIYRSLGACFGAFPVIIVSWLFIGWRIGARGSRLWLVPSLLAFPAFMIAGLPYVNEDARRIQCQNNLKQIGLAISNYEGTFRVPPDLRTYDAQGKPLHSWRTLVLPFMERQAEYRQIRFNEPWDSPHNCTLQNLGPYSPYRCLEEIEVVDVHWTNYLAIDGREASAGAASLKTSDAPVGTSNRLMLAEVSNSGIHWMEPRDLHVTQMAPSLDASGGQGPSSQHGRGVNVLMSDGRVQTLSPATDNAVLRGMISGD